MSDMPRPRALLSVSDKTGLVELAREVSIGRAYLLIVLYRAVLVEEEHPHRAKVGIGRCAAVVVSGCAHGQIRNAIAIKIPKSGHRTAELIVLTKVAVEPALALADFDA